VVRRNVAAGRLEFTTDIERAVAHGTIQFIAVGTPPDEDGSADLQYVLAAARNIGRLMTDYKVIVDKSTVPVGTADKVRAAVADELAKRGDLHFAVVSNPEFLKEGAAVQDFMKPDRIMVGADDEQAILLMRALYAPFMRNHDRLLVMDVRSAEFTKYAANAMLATRISFMNELARWPRRWALTSNWCARASAPTRASARTSCTPARATAAAASPRTSRRWPRPPPTPACLQVLTAVEAANDRRSWCWCRRWSRRYGEDLSGKTFAMWGLAFKPNTDDMREAPSRVVIAELLQRGAKVQAYDPVAATEANRVMEGWAGLSYADGQMQALEGADALLIVTEWKEFRTPDFEGLRDTLKDKRVFDGRNLYEPALIRGLEYQSIGRP
jgi:UDPglucose 6-dehydrogenase